MTVRRSVHAAAPQGVSFVELFFDLVFVFAVTQITAITAHDLTPTGPITPESYLGFERIDRFTGSKIYPDKEATYAFPAALGRDDFAYAGRWTVHAQRIVAGKDARLKLRYYARKVFLVLGGTGTVQVFVDGRPHGVVHVDSDRLYTLVDRNSIDDAVLELRFSPGVSAYAFTFG